ncbi:hypothetical protein V9T40_007452 [Parthenolecanium corni]|uniref:Uncharacterized protein n=1 Tax=Parthenolecanium corni TaxID=536013 RepID=A0AAN9U3L5_9HEMI
MVSRRRVGDGNVVVIGSIFEYIMWPTGVRRSSILLTHEYSYSYSYYHHPRPRRYTHRASAHLTSIVEFSTWPSGAGNEKLKSRGAARREKSYVRTRTLNLIFKGGGSDWRAGPGPDPGPSPSPGHGSRTESRDVASYRVGGNCKCDIALRCVASCELRRMIDRGAIRVALNLPSAFPIPTSDGAGDRTIRNRSHTYSLRKQKPALENSTTRRDATRRAAPKEDEQELRRFLVSQSRGPWPGARDPGPEDGEVKKRSSSGCDDEDPIDCRHLTSAAAAAAAATGGGEN